MRKQKTKKLFAKAFIAVFIINTICIFGFSTSTLAATELSINATPEDVYIEDTITISWGAVTKPSEGLVSFGRYYSYVYKSTDGKSSWQLIAIISGTGYKTFHYQPTEVKSHFFMVKEYATMIYFPYGQSSTYIVVGTGTTTNDVHVYSLQVTPDFIDYSTLTNVEEVTLSWFIGYDSSYIRQYSEIFQQTNDCAWELIDTIDGTGQKTLSVPLDKAGETTFKVVKWGHCDGAPGYPAVHDMIGEEISNTIEVTGINKYAIIVSGTNYEYNLNFPRIDLTPEGPQNISGLLIDWFIADVLYIDDYDDDDNRRNVDAVRFAEVLVKNYEYSPENIYLLMNPTDPWPDPYVDTTFRWLLDIYLDRYPGTYIPATIWNLIESILYIREKATKFDEVIVYWTSHSIYNNPKMIEYGDIWMDVTALDALLDHIECSEMYLFLDTDYGTSELIDYLQEDNRIIFTGTGDFDPNKGYFIDALTYGLSFEYDLYYDSSLSCYTFDDYSDNYELYSFHADTNYAGNNDGHVSLYELFEFAIQEAIRIIILHGGSVTFPDEQHKQEFAEWYRSFTNIWIGSKFSSDLTNIYINDGIVTTPLNS